MYEHLLYEVKDHIAIISINNPKTLNALDTATLTDMNVCFKAVAKDNDIKAVIVTGAGEKAFVAGADISEMVKLSPAESAEMSALADETMSLLEQMSKPVIAAVNGYALGGGNELALACDIRIASEKAVFGQPEVGLGIIPGFGGTQRLQRIVGKGIAKELIFTAAKIKADEAYRIGLANKVVAPEALMDTCIEMAKSIMKNSGYAIAMSKISIETGADLDLQNGIKFENKSWGMCFAHPERAEGMHAFLEKRPANFG